MLYVLISKNGVPVEKRAEGGDTKSLLSKLEAEFNGQPEMAFEVFEDESVPRYKDAELLKLASIPDVQEQLNAIWLGGDATEAMRQRMQPFLKKEDGTVKAKKAN